MMRYVVLWLHDEKCYLLNCREHADQVHHADYNNANNAITNLVPICSRCHRLIHKTDAHIVLFNRDIVILLLRKLVTFNQN